MISSSCLTPQDASHVTFLALLPEVERSARAHCRGLDPEALDDAVAEAVANAFVAFLRLADQNRTDAATSKSLARYAVRQYFAGRRIGNRLNGNDPLSSYAQRKHRFRLERLELKDDEGNWQQALVEDRSATPAELAASRIDFPAWLNTLTHRDRRVALRLASGHSPREVAKRFRLSVGRVSQLRREFAERWREFHEGPARERMAASTAA